jgi:hypothetical protein
VLAGTASSRRRTRLHDPLWDLAAVIRMAHRTASRWRMLVVDGRHAVPERRQTCHFGNRPLSGPVSPSWCRPSWSYWASAAPGRHKPGRRLSQGETCSSRIKAPIRYGSSLRRGKTWAISLPPD